MSKPRNRVARRKVMLPRTERNVVIARQVNPPSCVVVSKEVISRVMVVSVIVRPIPRRHVRGRDCGRDIRAIGTVPITELEKGGNETENILFRNLYCAGPARIFFSLHKWRPFSLLYSLASCGASKVFPREEFDPSSTLLLSTGASKKGKHILYCPEIARIISPFGKLESLPITQVNCVPICEQYVFKRVIRFQFV